VGTYIASLYLLYLVDVCVENTFFFLDLMILVMKYVRMGGGVIATRCSLDPASMNLVHTVFARALQWFKKKNRHENGCSNVEKTCDYPPDNPGGYSLHYLFRDKEFTLGENGELHILLKYLLK